MPARIFAREMGMLLPTIGVRDNIELEPNEYRFLLRGKEIARSGLVPDRYLAMNMGGANESKLDGISTTEPVFGFLHFGFQKKISVELKSKALPL